MPSARNPHRKMTNQANTVSGSPAPKMESSRFLQISTPSRSGFHIVCRLTQPTAYMCAFFYEK